MMLEVLLATPADQSHMQKLWLDYLNELGRVSGCPLSPQGRFFEDNLESCWCESRRNLFLFFHEGELVGFAIVDWLDESELNGERGVWEMREFYIAPKHRRKHLGQRAATYLFDHFRGRWQVREMQENEKAKPFWRKVIARYSGGHFRETMVDDERWHGPVQYLDTSRRSFDTPTVPLQSLHNAGIHPWSTT